MLEMLNCCICSQVLGDRENDLIAELLEVQPYVRRVPLEGSKFAVIPSLGPLAPGHTLLCPKKHYRSFALLPGDYEVEFAKVRVQMIQLLQRAYDLPVHIFEHGMARRGTRVLCTVEHAHLHFVPAMVDVWEDLASQRPWKTLNGHRLSDLRTAAGEIEYLYYETPNGPGRVSTLDSATLVESQFLRKVFANALGKPDAWDWRQAPAPLEAHETYKTILGELACP